MNSRSVRRRCHKRRIGPAAAMQRQNRALWNSYNVLIPALSKTYAPGWHFTASDDRQTQPLIPVVVLICRNLSPGNARC